MKEKDKYLIVIKIDVALHPCNIYLEIESGKMFTQSQLKAKVIYDILNTIVVVKTSDKISPLGLDLGEMSFMILNIINISEEGKDYMIEGESK